jgi:Tfp pilus assembly protein PilF
LRRTGAICRTVPEASVSRLRRAAAILVTLAVTAPAGAATASGQTPPAAAARPGGGLEAGATSLIELWNQRRVDLARGDVLAADEAESTLRERRRRNGVRRAQDVAGAFVLEGYENLALQHLAEARESFQLALEFDPDMPRAYLGLAATEWASDQGLIASVQALLDAGRAASRNWLYRTIGFQIGAWTVLLGFPAAVAVLLLLLFLKKLPLVHHWLTEVFSHRFGTSTARALAALFPLLPLALPWGAAWAPLLWLALAAPFLSRRERMVAVTSLLLVATCGVLLLPAARVTALSTDPRLVQVAGAARGAVGPERERTVAELLERRPDDAILQLLHADQARGMGDYATAIRSYRRAAELDPGLRQAHNNLGTLFFSLGQFATAIGEFRRAIEADPKDLTAHYNLYLTQEQRFDFSAAEQTLSAAQAMNLQRMTELLSEREKRKGRLDVLEDTVPVSVALEHARDAAGLAGPFAVETAWLWRAWPFLVFPLLTLSLIRFTRARGNLPAACPSCGRIACRLCALNLDDESTCASCAALAARSTSLPRRAREQKRREIAIYRRRQLRSCRLLALLVPGGGQIWSGRTLTGTFLLALATCGLVALRLRGQLPVISYTPIAPGIEPLWVGAICVAVSAWLIGWFLPRAPEFTTVGRR